MRDNHRPGRLVRGLRVGLVPLCLILPAAAAQAQTFSAGNLASSKAPSMPEAPEGYGTGGVGSLLPNLFDQLGMFVGLSERYTDNATGSSAAPQSNLDTMGMFGVTASRMSSRFSLMLNYGLTADYFANSVGNNDSILINNNLNASATMEVVQDHILFQAQAYASPVYASRLGNVLPAGQNLPPGANSDIRNSYGYVLQPDFTFKLGDFLRSDLVPSYSAYYYDAPEGAGVAPLGTAVTSNQFTRAITERISSGEFFNRVQWGAIASYSEMGATSSALTQRSATGEISYAIDHGLWVLADVGYQTVKARSAFRDILNGPTYMGGMRFNLTRLTGEFRVGEQYHSFSLTGNLNYQMTPRINLFASAMDGVNTPGAALFSPQALFGALIQGLASGRIQVPSGGLNLGNLASVVGLQDSVARFRQQTVGMNYGFEDLSLSVSAYNTQQNTQTAIPAGQNPDLRSTGVYVTVAKMITPEISGYLYTSYHSDTLQVGSSDSMDFGANASYALNQSTQLYVQGTYFKRFSSSALAAAPGGQGGDVSAVSILVGINHTIQ